MPVFYAWNHYSLEPNIAWQPIQKSISIVNHSLHAGSSSVLSFPLKIHFIYESKTTRLHSTSVKCFLQSSSLLSRLHQRPCSPLLMGCIHPQLLVVNQNGEGRTTKMFPNYLLCNQRSESLCNQKHGLWTTNEIAACKSQK